MTLITELVRDVVKVHAHIKFHVRNFNGSAVRVLTDRHTDTHTHTHTHGPDRFYNLDR